MTAAPALGEAERQALEAALDDEYKSYTTYDQVVRDFGEVRPFINIVEAEARHIAALLAVFATYGIIAPANRWPALVARFASLHEACVASVQGEIDNVAIYDRALTTTQRTDIVTTYQALRSASLDRHLPAFRRCAERLAGGPA